jgi:hypothetical protein
MKKDSHEHTISDLVDATLKRLGYGDVALCGDVETAYRKIVGDMINKLTYSCNYEPRTRVLYCKLASPALRQELTMHSDSLITSINNLLGRAEVRHILFK